MNCFIRRLLAASCAAACVLGATGALAQGSGSAEAEELFKEGRAALDARDYPMACTKLGESNRLERAVGTLISLAQCEEAQNKLASARQHWQEAADFADALQDRLQRGTAARQKFAELDKRVPRLTVTRAPSAPASITVRRDDVTLMPASFGSALPVDPGAHVIVVSAEGHEPKQFEIALAEGESKSIAVEPGAEIPVRPPPPETDAGPLKEGDGGSLRIAAYAMGGVGVVGLGLGTIFGLRAKSKWSDAQDGCKPGACGASSAAQANKDSATTSGNVSTVAFIVGGAALATGVVLFVVSRSPKTASTVGVQVGPTLGGVSAAGAF